MGMLLLAELEVHTPARSKVDHTYLPYPDLTRADLSHSIAC